MSGGFKYDAGKPRMDLIPAQPLLTLGKVYAMGAAKYTDRQWEKGMDWGRVYAALQRHLLAFWGGEDIDPESGLPHMAHVVWNGVALLEFMETHPELDSRAKTRNHVPPLCGEAPPPNAPPREDEQPVPRGDAGQLVLGPPPGSVGGVEVAPSATSTRPHLAEPDREAEGLGGPKVPGGAASSGDPGLARWRDHLHSGRVDGCYGS